MAGLRQAITHMRVLNGWLGDPRAIRKEMLEQLPDGSWRLSPEAHAMVDERLPQGSENVLTPDTDLYGPEVREALRFFGIRVPQYPGTGGVGTPTTPGPVDPESVTPLPGGRRRRRS